MDQQNIVVRGAREHNLRNVDLELPRDQLIVFTGVSGSGKSSLAFDTLYAEGQRRYVESLSSYARQFLGQLPKPDVEFLSGLSPSISIQQKTASRNPRSTVGTITEIYDFLRVLYARVGQGYCPKCDRPITAQSREQIITRILALPPGTRFLVLAPVVRGQKGEHKDLLADMLKRGFVRARVDGQIVRLTDQLQLDRRLKHDIAIVIDRLVVDSKTRPRLAEAIEQALHLAGGTIIVAVETDGSGHQDLLLSAHYACLHCEQSYEEPSPQLFSFNSPHGMCLACDGLGTKFTFDPKLLIPDPSLSMYEGAIPIVGPLRGMGRWRRHIFEGVAKAFEIDLKAPWQSLSHEQQDVLLHGAGDRHILFEWRRGRGFWRHGGTWEGIVPQLLSSFKKTAAGPRRLQLEKYMRAIRCPSCQGQRLNPQARAVRIADQSLVASCARPIGDLVDWFAEGGPMEQSLEPVQRQIAGELLKEIRGRLGFLLNVGLHYLTLDRSAPSLSGGESQRIRLAGQIGCGLVGVLYILDEPSIGLHPRDNDRLLRSLERLRDMGNTVLVVEHDEDTMRAADYIVDFGPGPGVRGGEIVARGEFRDIVGQPLSLTGQYLSGKKQIAIPSNRRPGSGDGLTIVGARHNNLKNFTATIPLGKFVCVTGVSGSGKSSLVNDVLLTSLRDKLANPSNSDEDSNGDSSAGQWLSDSRLCDRIEGAEKIDKIIDIDQSPIGRTPRSNPATYIKVFDEIRQLFSTVTEAKVRGYSPSRFSFNRPGGRCEACEGNGSTKLEMDFLADVWVTCPVCEGRRFNRETLQVRYRGKSIHDVLEMDIQEALELFENVPKVRAMLQTLHDVGLDYLKLGQPSPTLSGGEAQRIKLARELCKRSTGRTLYVLDEPTTGLHFDDIHKLLEVLHGFVDAGNTVLVIEHNLDVLKTADWLLDLGPDGGSGGGQLVAAGTPETVMLCERSYTGQALKRHLSADFSKLPAKVRKSKAKSGSSDGKALIKEITVHGASEHNLKHIDVSMPRDAMTVCCGPSGSGKSSLAIDTVYAEGQRRYVESLSSYARQFLGQVQKPRVERVEGLSPAIAIEQKTTSRSPRSTVGTITEIQDYLRVWFARLGQPHCPDCGIPVGTQTSDEIVDQLLSLPDGAKLYLLAPIERQGQERYESIWDEVRRSGFTRIRVDGRSYSLDQPPAIDRRRKHSVEVVVDRIVVRTNQRTRIADAVEQTLDLGRGVMLVAHVDSEKDETQWQVDRYSQHMTCSSCGRSFEPLNPHNFSFNSPLGWCPSCEGLGVQNGTNPALLIRDPKLTLLQGAVAVWPVLGDKQPFQPFAEAIARYGRFELSSPYESLSPQQQRMILQGTGDHWLSLNQSGVKFQYKGLLPAIDEASRISFVYRQRLDHVVSEVPCTSCGGSRLRDDAAAVRFADRTLGQLSDLPIGQLRDFFKQLKLSKHDQQIAGELLREIRSRLQFLVDVGLDYLTLSRPGPTLSGGEAQRIRLASQIGSGLTGVLYVLDEPTIGLHPRDNRRLLGALTRLRELGNTLLLVEHDREVIAAADYLLDFGPGAGDRGGEIVASGTPQRMMRSKASLTGKYLSGAQAIAVPTNRRIPAILPDDHPSLIIRGARQNNLKNVTVRLPLGALIAVTGVSGSGKSTLVHEVLYNTLARKLHRARTAGAAHDEMLGLDRIDKIINVDQDPIGNTPSSNPATFTGVFDLIRQLFAQLPESKVRGYQPRRFSFNKPGGRCEACEGNGQKKIEMHFLPDVWVECDVCRGKRYNPETLAVKYKDKSIADVLAMSVSDALGLFANIPKIRRILQTLADVGLEYLSLGQSAPTMSGGEAQRVKLAAELSRPQTGRTLYLLDEPTTGLHFDDIRKLLDVINRLVDCGNTVIVIEHNLDVIKSADWVVDLGPEAGDAGGQIVVEGPPEIIAESSISHTAAALKPVLAAGPFAERPRFDPNAIDLVAKGDVDLSEVGKDAQMPWEKDGVRWHTVDRLCGTGKPPKWEGSILSWLEPEIRKLGKFGATNWNHRSIVEIPAPVKSQGWFLHAMTGQQWFLRLVFRVSRNAFKLGELVSQLGLPSSADTPGLEHYGDFERVQVANRRGPWQEVAVLGFKLEELKTPAFRKFLKEAAESFFGNLKRMRTTPEDVMPWKINGEKWHLSDKGFAPGRRIVWNRTLLSRMLEVVREVEPKLTIDWSTRDSISIRVPGSTRAWAAFRTKNTAALECKFLGRSGQFNLARLEPIGGSAELRPYKTDAAVIHFAFKSASPAQLDQLKELLTEQIVGFRELFHS